MTSFSGFGLLVFAKAVELSHTFTCTFHTPLFLLLLLKLQLRVAVEDHSSDADGLSW